MRRRRNLPPRTELLFVDNASTDGTRAYLREVSEQMGGVEYLFFLRKLAEEVDRNWPAVVDRLEGKQRTLLREAAQVLLVDRGVAHPRPALRLVLDVARRQWRVARLDVRNSGDTSGDRSRVVGYASFAIV